MTVPIPVAASADLQLTKVASAAAGTAGVDHRLHGDAGQPGPSVAQNVTITDVLSAGLSYIGATTNGNVAVNNVGQSTVTAPPAWRWARP